MSENRLGGNCVFWKSFPYFFLLSFDTTSAHFTPTALFCKWLTHHDTWTPLGLHLLCRRFLLLRFLKIFLPDFFDLVKNFVSTGMGFFFVACTGSPTSRGAIYVKKL